MAPDEYERFMRDVAEFKGRAEEALKTANERYKELTTVLKTNHECLTEMKVTVDAIQREIAVQRAVQKVKNAMYGAVGGVSAAILIQVLAAFLKLRIFGG